MYYRDFTAVSSYALCSMSSLMSATTNQMFIDLEPYENDVVESGNMHVKLVPE
jgi:hypothetical protein